MWLYINLYIYIRICLHAYIYIWLYMYVRERERVCVCVSNHVFQVEHHGLTLLSTSDMNCDQSAGHGTHGCPKKLAQAKTDSRRSQLIGGSNPAHHFLPIPDIFRSSVVISVFAKFRKWSCSNIFHQLFYQGFQEISSHCPKLPAVSCHRRPSPPAARSTGRSTSRDWRWTRGDDRGDDHRERLGVNHKKHLRNYSYNRFRKYIHIYI